jgi:hypothetical protein
MKRSLKLLNIFVVSAWGILLLVLLYKNYIGMTLEKTVVLGDAFNNKVYWYGIYVMDSKIGSAHTSIDRIGQEIIIKHEREIKVKKEGKEQLFVEKLTCLSDLHYSIKSLEYVSHFDDEKGIKVTGQVESGEILFFLESSEKRKTYKTRTDGIFYLPTTFLPVIIRNNPAPGTAFSVPFLNFANLSIDTARVVLEDIRPLKVGTNIVNLYKFKSGDTFWWCDERGDIIKEKNPIGGVMYSEVEIFAKDPAERILFDYTELPAIKANRVLTDSEAGRFLKVRIRNLTLNPKIYLNCPIAVTDDILTIRKRTFAEIKGKSYQLPYKEEKYAKYTQPDEWVMSTYEPLSKTGRIYAKSYNNDTVPFANYLTSYLFQLIRTTPSFVLSNSEQIFKSSLYGDYLEKTVMFATYARAAGLPTRLIGGLIYRDGYFYFHAWPEIWLQEWIPVDPTYNQFPADVTHIPIREGTLQDITSFVGELKKATIEILEAS